MVTQWQELGSNRAFRNGCALGRQRSAGSGRETATRARIAIDNWQATGKEMRGTSTCGTAWLRNGSGAAHHTDTALQDLDWPCRELSACELAYAKISQRAVCICKPQSNGACTCNLHCRRSLSPDGGRKRDQASLSDVSATRGRCQAAVSTDTDSLQLHTHTFILSRTHVQ